MISRRSALLVAQIYQRTFSFYYDATPRSNLNPNPRQLFYFRSQELRDFLYARDYEDWFLNLVRHLPAQGGALKDFIMELHTGQSVLGAPIPNDLEKRKQYGQRNLQNLSKDIIKAYETPTDDYGIFGRKSGMNTEIAALKSELELDGYIYKDGLLYPIESSVIEEHEERSYLELLVNGIPLHNQAVIKHHIKESEKAYAENRWGHSISDARNFLEAILQQVANAHHLKYKKANLPTNIYSKPVKVREYLEAEGLIDKPEQEAIWKIYGLISNTGSHPNIAEKDQARLMRHLALTFSQYILLQYEGYLRNNP